MAAGQTVTKEVTTSVTQTAAMLEFPLAETAAARAETMATVENCILKDWD